LPQFVLLGACLLAVFSVLGHTLMAVVFAAAAARVLSSGLFLLYTNSQIGVGQWAYAWQVLLPGIAPYAVGYGLAYLGQGIVRQLGSERLVVIPALAALGAVYGIIAFSLLYAVFCPAEERQAVRRMFGRLNPRRRRAG
jgi:hypothetical protein